MILFAVSKMSNNNPSKNNISHKNGKTYKNIINAIKNDIHPQHVKLPSFSFPKSNTAKVINILTSGSTNNSIMNQWSRVYPNSFVVFGSKNIPHWYPVSRIKYIVKESKTQPHMLDILYNNIKHSNMWLGCFLKALKDHRINIVKAISMSKDQDLKNFLISKITNKDIVNYSRSVLNKNNRFNNLHKKLNNVADLISSKQGAINVAKQKINEIKPLIKNFENIRISIPKQKVITKPNGKKTIKNRSDVFNDVYNGNPQKYINAINQIIRENSESPYKNEYKQLSNILQKIKAFNTQGVNNRVQ